MPAWLDASVLSLGWAIAAPLGGFVVALLTFEWNEWRKRTMARQSVRRAVIAEFRQVELNLSSIYVLRARGAAEAVDAAAEMRWLWTVGRPRLKLSGLAFTREEEEYVAGMAKLPDEDLIAYIQQQGSSQTMSPAHELAVPVADGALLLALSSSLTGPEMESLSAVSFQFSLLRAEARWLAEMTRLTFTVEDQGNRDIVMRNIESFRAGYRRRCLEALRAVRVAAPHLEAASQGVCRRLRGEVLRRGRALRGRLWPSGD